MRYVWDKTKSERNERERGLPFDLAREINLDSSLVEQDVRHDYGEPRYVVYGMIGKRLHVLCFTPIPDGIRIISFRKANVREIHRYEQETANR